MHKDGEKIGNVIGNRTTFSELRCREVINIQDGARLGQVSDLEIDLCTGTVMGLMVPGERRGLGLLRNREGLCIPFARIKKFGEDVILVELCPRVCYTNLTRNCVQGE